MILSTEALYPHVRGAGCQLADRAYMRLRAERDRLLAERDRFRDIITRLAADGELTGGHLVLSDEHDDLCGLHGTICHDCAVNGASDVAG